MKTKVITKSTENQPVVYSFYRVSTDKQNNDRQIEDVRKYCKAFDFDLQKEFQETISGAASLKDRKELQALLKYVDENKPDYIICSELSRLARSQDAVSIIKGWTDKGICFISLKENIKTLDSNGNKNPMTDLLLGILTAINVFELETIKFRVKSGLRKTANKGTWIGCVPFGYSVENQKLVIDPDESETLKMMFEKYNEGWGNNKIASYLNRNKITTKQGRTWKDTSVYKILNNSIAVGKRVWGGETIDMPELRVVEDSVFTSVQDRIHKNANIEPINKHYKNDYLLTGKVLCSCGKHFVGVSRSNIYMCKSKKYASGCNVKSININYLDEAVKKHLMINYSKMLNDNSAVINKTVELKEELSHLQELINDEKETQNYLINNLRKMGQQKFDEKFDASSALVTELQKQIDIINIKLSNTNTYIKMPAIGIINPEFENEINNSDKKVYTSNIFSKVVIDKNLVQKIIETIRIDNEEIIVNLIDGSTFNINRK
jgi:site-specific DNA recombinase